MVESDAIELDAVQPDMVAATPVPNAVETTQPETSVPQPAAMANAATETDAGADPFLADPFATSSTESEIPAAGIETAGIETAGTETAGTEKPAAGAPNKTVASIPTLDAIADQRERLIGLVPKLSRPIVIEEAPTALRQLNDLESELNIGSDDFWVIRSMIAEVTWLTGSCDDVVASLQPLADRYDADLHQLLTQSYIASPKFVETEAAHERRLTNGLNLCDQILIWEQFDQVELVLHAIQPSINFFGDPQRGVAAKQISDACKQMIRLRESALPVLAHPDDPNVSESAAGITGRYLCLMRRQWNNGLVFLAKGTDARLSNLAQQELELSGLPSTKELADLGNRWIVLATRIDGRAGDSIRLHAISLYQQALIGAEPLMKLELQRLIDLERKNLPQHLNASLAQPLS